MNQTPNLSGAREENRANYMVGLACSEPRRIMFRTEKKVHHVVVKKGENLRVPAPLTLNACPTQSNHHHRVDQTWCMTTGTRCPCQLAAPSLTQPLLQKSIQAFSPSRLGAKEEAASASNLTLRTKNLGCSLSNPPKTPDVTSMQQFLQTSFSSPRATWCLY